MKRRAFIAGLAGAAALPLAARAQQARPVIGFLSSQSSDQLADQLRTFRESLKSAGYVDGENVAVEYRFADNTPERLSALAAEFVRRRVAAIVAIGGPASAVAAKATKTIPIVFAVPEDPVRLGMVASLARPGGNATGINFFTAELTSKRLELLRELVPGATRVAVLVNPAEATIAETVIREVKLAALAMGLQIQVLNAGTIGEINDAFAAIARERSDAFFAGSGPFFNTRRVQLAHLATRVAVPAIYAQRAYVEAGGLVSYGTDSLDRYRQIGNYAGRILKGEKPAEMPVAQSTKFELVINVQTARMLGLTVPPTLLARADEVIE